MKKTGKSHSYIYVKDIIESFDYILLSDIYQNQMSKLKLQCNKGHIFDIVWKKFITGSRCRKCHSENRRLGIDYIREHIKKIAAGYECLSSTYKNNSTKLKFKCDKEHMFEASWNHFSRGARCPHCYNLIRGCFGEDNPMWNPNLTKEHREDTRNYPEYKEWVKKIYKKDNYTCQKCKQYGGSLNAHHIKSYSSVPKLRTEISNGITFCIDCHNNFHHIYGKGNNTKEQLEEFLCQ